MNVLLKFMILNVARFYVSYLYPYFFIYSHQYIYVLLNYAYPTAVF